MTSRNFILSPESWMAQRPLQWIKYTQLWIFTNRSFCIVMGIYNWTKPGVNICMYLTNGIRVWLPPTRGCSVMICDEGAAKNVKPQEKNPIPLPPSSKKRKIVDYKNWMLNLWAADPLYRISVQHMETEDWHEFRKGSMFQLAHLKNKKIQHLDVMRC